MENEEMISIQQERSYAVVKGSEIIQRASHDLTAPEQKLFAFLVSKIRPDDQENQIYEFSLSEYCRVLGIDVNNGKNNRLVKQSLKILRDKSFELTLENGEVTFCSWINKPWINQGSGKIRIRFDDDIQRFLVGLLESKKYTQYQLLSILPMKSMYSIRIYELLKSYSYTKRPQRFELEDLKHKLACTHYKRFPDFRRKVLDPATLEINMYTDIEISWEPITQGRKVIALEFEITEKDAEDRYITSKKVNNLLDGQVPGQLSIQDYFKE